jgi:hypothetical protein
MATDWKNFEALSEDSPTSLTWASTGGEGSGKSYFACTAPGPIFIAAFDAFGMNRVDAEVKKGKEIKIARYPFNPTKYKTDKEVAVAANALWKKFLDDYQTALDNGVRTIIWDREDMAYKLQRYASFGGSSAAPKEYEDLYVEYVGLIQEAQARQVNLGLLRGLREKWVSKFDAGKQKMVGHNTGEMQPAGMKNVPDQVDITLFHRWDEKEKAYITTIGKFTNASYRGMELPNLTFPQMAYAAFPESNEENWAA